VGVAALRASPRDLAAMGRRDADEVSQVPRRSWTASPVFQPAENVTARQLKGSGGTRRAWLCPWNVRSMEGLGAMLARTPTVAREGCTKRVARKAPRAPNG
jgi:hypothetical protein